MLVRLCDLCSSVIENGNYRVFSMSNPQMVIRTMDGVPVEKYTYPQVEICMDCARAINSVIVGIESGGSEPPDHEFDNLF